MELEKTDGSLDNNHEELQKYNEIKTRRENLTQNLDVNVQSIKSIIKQNIPELVQGDILRCIGFFYFNKPKIGKQLFLYMEKGDVQGFITTVYQNIDEAMDLCLSKTYHDDGPKANPGKNNIIESKKGIENAKELIDDDNYTRSDVPPILSGLLPIDWMDM